jgi:hypothetical protein
MMMGRAGYCGAWCVYWKLKQLEWTKIHNQGDSCNCGGKKWTIEQLHHVMAEQLQKDADGTSYPSCGVKEFLI